MPDAAPISSRQWYYAAGSAHIGPVPEQAIIQMLSAAQINAETLVWNDSMRDWAPVKSIAEFAPHSRLAPPTVPGAIPGPLSTDHGVGMRMLLPVGRSPWAIASGYLGLLSVLFIFAPFAVLCGVIAIVHMRRNPAMHGMGRAIFGIVMGTVFTLFYAIALLASALGK